MLSKVLPKFSAPIVSAAVERRRFETPLSLCNIYTNTIGCMPRKNYSAIEMVIERRLSGTLLNAASSHVTIADPTSSGFSSMHQ
jgi:hypothetical protein